MGCLLGLAPLIFLQRTDGGTTSGSTVIALAGKDVRGNLSQPEDAAVVCSKPEAVERGGETVFATISTVATPKFQGLGLAQNLGGTVIILSLTVAMAVKRVQKFMKNRKSEQ